MSFIKNKKKLGKKTTESRPEDNPIYRSAMQRIEDEENAHSSAGQNRSNWRADVLRVYN